MAAVKSTLSLPARLIDGEPARSPELGFQKSLWANAVRFGGVWRGAGIVGGKRWMVFDRPIAASEATETTSFDGNVGDRPQQAANGVSNCRPPPFPSGIICPTCGSRFGKMSTIGKSSNILWHDCSVKKADREELLKQKGCVIWITGLSGSGKSTVACALSRILHSMGRMTYVLDGDNLQHGLNSNLSFGAEDRTENIRRTGEVAKLFADAGIICIASLISPYIRDRDACRKLLPEGNFIEVYMDVPLEVCEARDPKGLYKLARAGKIKGFTGIDDPYEKPLKCEIVLQQKPEECLSPCDMAETVVSYLANHGYLQG